jgi:hypothetical protein
MCSESAEIPNAMLGQENPGAVDARGPIHI